MALRATCRPHPGGMWIVATGADQLPFRLSKTSRLKQTITCMVDLDTVACLAVGPVKVHLVIGKRCPGLIRPNSAAGSAETVLNAS